MKLLRRKDAVMPAREEVIGTLRRTPGWLEEDEAWALHEAVRNHPSHRPALTVVEIGSWRGRSAVALASALRARGSGVLHAIDPHRETAIHRGTGVEDTFEEFLANVRAAGLHEYVRPIRSLSTVARPMFAAGSVDVLFVDGAHGYQDVLRDIDEWTPALADVATVAFHDAVAYEDVRRALSERIVQSGSPFRNLRIVENMLLTDFRRGALWTTRDTSALQRFSLTWRSAGSGS